jgi:hypothetical protein
MVHFQADYATVDRIKAIAENDERSISETLRVLVEQALTGRHGQDRDRAAT